MENPLRTSSSPAASGASTGERVLDRAASGVHGAVDKVAGVADDAARAAMPAIDRAAAIAHQAVDKATSAAAPTAQWLSSKGEHLNATRKAWTEETCKFVSTNPGTTIGLALAIGFLIGRIRR